MKFSLLITAAIIAVLATPPIEAQVEYDFPSEIAIRIDSDATNTMFSLGYLHELRPTTWPDITNKCKRLASVGNIRIILLAGTNITDTMAQYTAKEIKDLGFINVPILRQVSSQQDDDAPLFLEQNGTIPVTIYSLQVKWMNERIDAQQSGAGYPPQGVGSPDP